MESEPQTESGRRLLKFLSDWTRNYRGPALDKLKRKLLMYSSKVKNEDAFVLALHGQSVLEESPVVLSQQIPTPLLRVQHAMEISLSKRCLKELVVAVEWSENDSLLTEILKWAETNQKEITEKMESLSIDLAPQKLQKSSQLSGITSGMTPRHRKIDWDGEKKKSWRILVCGNKIVVGWDNGQIKIYNSKDLRCETALSYRDGERGVTGLQCTCKEILAGHNDGSIFVWNIEKGTLVQKFSVMDTNSGYEYVNCMRWRDPKLVVGTIMQRVKIWQSVSSSFTLLDSWKMPDRFIDDLDFNQDCIFLLQHYFHTPDMRSKSVHIMNFNGRCLRSITLPQFIMCMSPAEDYFVTAADDNRGLRIWEMSTGVCVGELEGHEDDVSAAYVQDGVIASADCSGRVIIWSAQAAREGKLAELARFTDSTLRTGHWSPLKLGHSFVVTNSHNHDTITITDFLS